MYSRCNRGVYRQLQDLPNPTPPPRKRNDVEMVRISGLLCTIEHVNGSDRVIVDVLGKGRLVAPNRAAVDEMVLDGRWEGVDKIDIPQRRDLRTMEDRLEKFAIKCQFAVLPEREVPDSHVHVQRMKVRDEIVYVVRHRINGVLLHFGIVPSEEACLDISRKTLEIINAEIRGRNQGKDQDVW